MAAKGRGGKPASKKNPSPMAARVAAMAKARKLAKGKKF